MENTTCQGVERLQGRWKRLAVLGVLSIVLGTLAVGASLVATLTTVIVLGWLVLSGGILHGVKAFQTHGSSGFFGHVLAAILYCFVGGYMIVHPAISAASLTLLIGLLLGIGGVFQMIAAVSTRHHRWGWPLVNGAISLLLALMIYRQWPASTLWVIGTFVGIDLIFRGWATLMLALALKRPSAA